MAQPIPTTQPAAKRNKNFQEVSHGYPKKLAIDESRRCPQCLDPVCMKGCPLGIDIPAFIRLLREGNAAAAFDKIREKNFFPSVCGRICSAPCEAACILNDEASPIGIRSLERYAADFGRSSKIDRKQFPRKGKHIGIIGSGPAGLSAAVDLAQKGYQITIFEGLEKPGGVLRYGIPEFRIPRKTLDDAFLEMKSMGIEIKTNCFVGQTSSLFEISKQGFAAVLLALGAGVPKFMQMPGTNLGGVYYGEEFLMRLNLIKATMFAGYKPNFFLGQKVAVIGSGNTALDCARAALRLGREVVIIFRRTEEDMLVRYDDRQFAKEEGLQLEPLTKPVEIIGGQDNFVTGLKCVRMDFADDDKETGKWELLAVPDSEFILDVDTVIMAVGHQPNSMIQKLNPMLKVNSDKTIWINSETGMTSLEGVFACGNVVTNAGPVVQAMASGKKAALHIDKFLMK